MKNPAVLKPWDFLIKLTEKAWRIVCCYSLYWGTPNKVRLYSH